MNGNIAEKYTQALDFWNTQFALTEEAKEKYREKAQDGTGGRSLAYSRKLADIICDELAGCENVLDYGCGRAWAGISLKKAGCPDVTCVDLSENAIAGAKWLSGLYGINSGFRAEAVDRDWLAAQPDSCFLGAVTSNVLDVIPGDETEYILRELRRVTAPDARLVIGMNYYMEPKDNPERKITVDGQGHVFVEGILRMVTRSDEEWSAIIGRYFTIERLEHYAWTGEETERRRVFVLRNDK